MAGSTNPIFDATPQEAPQPAKSDISPNENAELVLCLSGGGFRATLFHLGVVRRLNELGVLSKINAITSVSGGSILNGVLATGWAKLRCDAEGYYSGFDQHVASPIRNFCSHDLRTRLLVGVRINPHNWPLLVRDYFSIPASFLAAEYAHLYQSQSLKDIQEPAPRVPRFVFCATNVQTGACWHFHSGQKGRMGDFYTGYTDCGTVSVAQAVAASSSFPPGFSALRLAVKADQKWSRLDPWGAVRPESTKRPRVADSQRRQVLLTDGGVYDNLGLEPVWSRRCDLLVSDAGMPFDYSSVCQQHIVARLGRAFNISANQVGAVRKRWLLESFRANRRGAIWQIDTLIEEFPIRDYQGYSSRVRSQFPLVRTDLNAFTNAEMACLENHGYSLADAAIRSRTPWACTRRSDFSWPHPEWADESATETALKDSSQRHLIRDTLHFFAGKFAE